MNLRSLFNSKDIPVEEKAEGIIGHNFHKSIYPKVRLFARLSLMAYEPL